jgi:exopolyphosphatase/guanosine-5'-triphosphate,3'-diphosphate pyrophosphatase
MQNRPVVAVTLGSNGFHLLEVANVNGKLQSTQHLYENVQAESFLDESLTLTDEGVASILQAVKGFGEYLDNNSDTDVAAIATGTFRRAKNADTVIHAISEILGCPVKVLSGQDESLMCYTGIASASGFADYNRLVMDIGGGSTELMIAKKNTLIEFCSLDIGCVSLTKQAFASSTIQAENFESAVGYVKEVVSEHKPRFEALGWEEVMGCGGTTSSLFSVMQAKRMAGRFITNTSLDRFQNSVVESGSALPLCEEIVQAKRSLQLTAGMAIMKGIFEALGIEKLAPVFSSVGQGVVLQLIQQQLQRK